MLGNRPDTPAPRLLRVDRSARPGWVTGREQPPQPGQAVYCTEGMAEVVRILGKTGDGSRLLELRLLEKEAPPFYAAASNVLVMPAAGSPNGAPDAAAPVVRNGAAPAQSPGGVPADAERPGAAAAGAADDIDAALPRDVAHTVSGMTPPAPPPDEPGTPAAADLDVSWALDGSAVPGGAPLPGSTAKGGSSSPTSPPAAPAPAGSAAAETDDAEPGGVAGGVAAGPEDDAEHDEDAAPSDVIGTPHGPGPQPDEDDPDATPPAFPLDPRVYWIR